MRWTLKKIISPLLGILLVGAIAFYAFAQSRPLLSDPQITIFSPTHGETTPTPLTVVRGKAMHMKELTLNGRPIFIDLEGNFAESLLLSPGYNIIELTAKDAQGREVTKKLEVTRVSEE